MVRPQSMQKPTLIHAIGPPPPPTTFRPIPATTSPTPPPPKSDTALQATTTECPPNSTLANSITGKGANGNNLLRKLASSHYQSYTTALTVTIAVGCFLLLLNILIFAGIYHQRDRGRNSFGDKKKEELAEAGSCSSSSGETYEAKSMSQQFDSRKYDCKSPYELSRVGSFECKSSNFECKSSNFECKSSSFGGEYSYEKRSLAETQLSELPLQEFKSSPPSGVKRIEGQLVRPPSYTSDVTNENNDEQTVTSPSIPEPPPPPKTQPPSGNNQPGILRSQTAPTTPGTMKKRVQIQEISV